MTVIAANQINAIKAITRFDVVGDIGKYQIIPPYQPSIDQDVTLAVQVWNGTNINVDVSFGDGYETSGYIEDATLRDGIGFFQNFTHRYVIFMLYLIGQK